MKIEVYNFIKNYLTNNERISYLFVVGKPFEGKTLFVKKAKIYAMNRNVFNDELIIDLKKKQIDNMLRFKLEFEKLIILKIHSIIERDKDKRIIPLIIFDHC